MLQTDGHSTILQQKWCRSYLVTCKPSPAMHRPDTTHSPDTQVAVRGVDWPRPGLKPALHVAVHVEPPTQRTLVVGPNDGVPGHVVLSAHTARPTGHNTMVLRCAIKASVLATRHTRRQHGWWHCYYVIFEPHLACTSLRRSIVPPHMWL